MMNYVRYRRPPPHSMGGLANRAGYVLRRYGGLNVFVPSLPSFGGLGYRADPIPENNAGAQLEVELETDQDTSSEDHEIYGNLEPLGSTTPQNPFGKFTPLFGGRIVLGPNKCLFIVSSIILAALTASVVLEKELIEKYAGGLPVLITGTVLSALSLLSFLITGITDPGVIPANHTLQELLAETEEYRVRHPDERFYQWCTKCRICRPPRTFHCTRCEICIRQQDIHFCSAGTCIGERNRVSYFFTVLFQTLLAFYLLVTNLIIAPNLEKDSDDYTFEMVQVVSCSIVGVALLFFPQAGIFVLIYRIYLVCVGRTAREEYRKFRSCNTDDCVLEKRSFFATVWGFFCQRVYPSSFRRKLNRVDPENMQDEMPLPWILEHTFGHDRASPSLRDSHDLIHPAQAFVEPEEDDDLNANESAETVQLEQVANSARRKLTLSVPFFEHGMKVPLTRIKIPRRSKPVSILQQQITALQEASQLPKATISMHERQRLPVSLSDGCIPRTTDGLPEMIQLSRATQLRRIIQMILLRDREGLVQMSNRVNIAALVGMNRFDPDNLQLLELQNGLPMITPRRREGERGQPRLGAGVLGIPQMVAAGLLPTARDLANSVQAMVGRGMVQQRYPAQGRQRYTQLSMMPPGQQRRHAQQTVHTMSTSTGPPPIPRIIRLPMHMTRNGTTAPRSTSGRGSPMRDAIFVNNTAISEDDDPATH